MKSKKVLFLLVCCFTAFGAKAQTEVPASNVKTIRLNCPDSLGYVTNTAGPYRACEFYFHHKDPAPTIFYVENFTHIDFHELIYKNDKSKIAKVKLVRKQPSKPILSRNSGANKFAG